MPKNRSLGDLGSISLTQNPAERPIHILESDPDMDGGYFVQVSVDLLKSDVCSPAALKLYLILLSYCGRGVKAWPGQARLAGDMHLTERSIRNLLTELGEAGLLSIEHRAGKTNLYRLHKFQLKRGAEPAKEKHFQTHRKESSAPKSESRKNISAESHAAIHESHAIESHTEPEIVCDTGVQESEIYAQEAITQPETPSAKVPAEHLSYAKTIKPLVQVLEKAGIWKGAAGQLAILAHKNGRDEGYISQITGWIQQQQNLANPSAYLAMMVRQNADPPPLALRTGRAAGGKANRDTSLNNIDWSKYAPGGKYGYLQK